MSRSIDLSSVIENKLNSNLACGTSFAGCSMLTRDIVSASFLIILFGGRLLPEQSDADTKKIYCQRNLL